MNPINFAGYSWSIKASTELMGPGPNYFSADCVRLQNGELTLEIVEKNGKTYCGEVILNPSLGYGKYYFFLSSRVDILTSNLVLGLFTWSDTAPEPNCEIDIECSRWDGQTITNMQFAVQPFDAPNHLDRFSMSLDGTYTTHIIDWRPNEVLFQSLYGHYLVPPTTGHIIRSWRYAGSVVPNNERIHINLWKYGQRPLQKTKDSLSFATIKNFIYQPMLVS